MDDQTIKTALSYSLGEDLHEAWCTQELQAFFMRLQKELATTESYGQALEKACYKGEDKRNEIEIDTGWLVGHDTTAALAMRNFDDFKKLVDGGVITIKRFTKRNLTSEEIERIGADYVDGKENILRRFSELSRASQEDNLEAAKVAIEQVYDKTIAGEPISPEELEQMGANIHEEWLKRNTWVYDPNYGDPKLAVPYEQLSEDEKDKDKAQIGPALAKVQSYLNGLIDTDSICEQYGIESAGKSL